MCKRDDTNFAALELIDDRVREAPQRKSTPTAVPDWTKERSGTGNGERSLELGDQRQSDFGACFSCVKTGRIDQLALGFETDRRVRFNASRARAIASAAGTTGARPASISAIRRWTSAAQVSSIPASSERLAMRRSARRTRSSGASFNASASNISICIDIEPSVCCSARRRTSASASPPRCNVNEQPPFAPCGRRRASEASPPRSSPPRRGQPAYLRSKRSRFITLCQAATKSSTNLRRLSSQA